MKTTPTPLSRLASGLTGGLFLLAISIPGLDMLLRRDLPPTQKAEFREPANLPQVPETLADLNDFPAAFTDYFQDRFGMREELLKLNNRLKWSVLRESPTNSIVQGLDEWVFYALNQTIGTWRGANPFPDGQLEARRNLIESRRDWLAGYGIDYLYVIVPDKTSVYPEYLPARFQKSGPSRREQFFEYMAEHSSVSILDLTDAVVAEKEFDQGNDYTYNKFGTHWTDRGALAGYRRIMGELGGKWPDLRARPRGDFQVSLGGDASSDSWNSRLYLPPADDEKYYAYDSKSARRMSQDSSVVLPRLGAAYTVADDSLPRLLLLHDSFGPTLRPYLGEHFRSFWSLWRGIFDKESILRHRPDMVIELRVERVFATLRVSPDGELSDATKERLGVGAEAGPLLHLDRVSTPVEWSEISGQGETELTFVEGEGMRISTTSPTDIVLLPEVQFEGPGPWLVDIGITSDTDTNLGLLFQTEAAPSFGRARLVTTPLKAGENQVSLRLTEPTILSGLALRPGHGQGHFVLTSVDVRARD